MSYNPNQPQPPYEQPQSGQEWRASQEYSKDRVNYSNEYESEHEQKIYPQQPRQSRRALWIVLGIVGGLIVLSCATSGIFFALGIGFFARTVAAPTNVVNEYYSAIKIQDYATAYSYLEPTLTTRNGQPLTKDLYTTRAQERDTLYGTVFTFTVGSISLYNGIASVTVTVKRTNALAYNDHLQLEQVNSTWKIIFFDKI